MPICSPFVDTNVGKITVHTSGTRPTGADLYEGKWIYESDTDRTLFYTGAAWVIMNEPAQSYTPTYTNITVGNGVTDFTYRRSDGFCEIEGQFTFGTTSAVTGLIGISPPAGITLANVSSSVVSAVGWYFDSSTSARYPLFILPATTSQFDLYTFNAAAATSANVLVTSATSPVATPWTSDIMYLGARFRMASRTS